MIRVIEGFSGIGSQTLALRDAGIPHKVVAISEINSTAALAYRALHGKVRNLGDIRKIDMETLPDCDLFTYTIDCEGVSRCSRKEGLSSGKLGIATMWNCMDIIQEKKPKYLLMEHVKGILDRKNRADFERWQCWLEEQGYTNYIKVLNALDFNVPQYRERLIMVSIQGKHKSFVFPEGVASNRTISDILESNVDEKYNIKEYYRNDLKLDVTKKKSKKGINRLGNISKTYGRGNAGGIYAVDGVAPTLLAGNGVGGNNTPHIMMLSDDGTPFVRRLTPTECLRLMGLKDLDIQRLKGMEFSDAKLYRLAGNAIVVDMLSEIFKQLFQ